MMQIGKRSAGNLVGVLEDEGDAPLSKQLVFLNYVSQVLYNKRREKKVNLKLDVIKFETS